MLTKGSVILEKHIRTHSFRATVITELLKSTLVDQVKEVIGDKSIGSTRSRLQPRQVNKILNQIGFLYKRKERKKKKSLY